jgi:hypothetical protein
MGNGEQRNPIFIARHDARHALRRGSALRLIKLGFARRDGSGILGLQQLRATRILRPGNPGAQQKSPQQQNSQHSATGENWQPQSPRIE